ncbi:MAG: MBL fold metallo-hydrolase [Prolixibacteraceae bacterium]|nr:MBL fold metallo-hydrolase [Prolixibacteraceae bacterium]
MKAPILFAMVISFVLTGYTQTNNPAKTFEKDSFETSKGELVITFIGHGTLMLEAVSIIIHIDPVSREADYALLPKADLILITHEHGDHLDPKALALVTKPETKTVVSKSCIGKIDNALVLINGEEKTFGDIMVQAVPAYNIVNMREGKPYHPKGNGNGYVITFAGKRIFVAGDTENIPEMAALKNIDIVFLPMNLPYTMTPQMVADGARSFMPKILYPYHFGETNPQLLVDLLKESPIEVRIRKMK